MSAEREEALRWLQFSGDDLSAARAIFADKHLPARLVCFHCQQSIEKALKAALVHRGIRFPRTHDLNLLVRAVPEDLSPKISSFDLSSLNVFAAEARYPGDYPDVSNEDGRLAIQLSEQILNIIKTALSEPNH
jgi:HEPN domain-containing protein